MAYKLVNCGDYRQRRSFSRIKKTYELKDLLEIQKKSYQWFIDTGIKEVFEDLFPVENFSGTLSLEFGDYHFDEPRYTIKESRDRETTFAAPLKIDVRLFIVSLFVLLCSILSSNYYLINASYIVFLPISVIYISNEVSLNGSKPIKFLGEISYPVYLFGFAVQQCVVSSFGGSMSPYLNFVISTIISIILGGLLNCLMTVLRKKYKWL